MPASHNTVVDDPAVETPFADYRRGYSPPKAMRSTIADAHRTRFGLTLAVAVGDHLVVFLMIAAAGWSALHTSAVVCVIITVLAVLVVSRQLRALECLVHESSHFNWSRGHRRWNDVLAFVLAGMPTGARISGYRASHLLHHGRFGTAQDPDRQRYLELGLEGLRVQSRWGVARHLIRQLPRYQIGWMRALRASPVYALLPLLWTVIAVAPTALILGSRAAVVGALVWLVSYVLVLPVIRLIGEASEHVYAGTDTVFDATISNLGGWQRLVVHPHNDGYHTVHHMWPGVPHHALRKLHESLIEQDPDGYGRRLRYRTRMLEVPRSGVLSADGHLSEAG
jgi:fatty acid desaturase